MNVSLTAVTLDGCTTQVLFDDDEAAPDWEQVRQLYQAAKNRWLEHHLSSTGIPPAPWFTTMVIR